MKRTMKNLLSITLLLSSAIIVSTPLKNKKSTVVKSSTVQQNVSKISQETLNILRVCFCSPILEGYGLTETGSAVCLTSPIDPVGSTVGGPLSSIRLRLKEIPEINSFANDEYLSGEI